MITDNSVSDVAHEHPVNEDLMTTDPPKQCTCFEILHSGQHTRRGESRPLLGCDHPDCPYRYLQRDTFTSEAFKIQVKNVHRYTGFKQLKKLLDTLNVKYRKVKLLKDVTFITLSSVEDRDAAVTVLNGHVWRGQTLEAKIAAGRADPLLEKKHRAFDEPEGTDAKRLRICEEIFDGTDPADLLRDTVTPLWRLPYDPDQIAEKRSALLTTLAITRSRLIGCNWSIESLLCDIDSVERDSSNNACVCPLLDTIRSPIITNYRNKSELTIGRDLDGRGPVIGFRFSKYRDGLTAVGCFHGCTILPRATMDMLDHLQKFLDSYVSACPVSETTMDPPLDTLNPTTHQGHWRQVVSRESRNGDRLLLVDIHPQNLSKDEIQRVSDRLTRWFTDCDKPKVTSLFLATRTRTSESFDATNTKLLWGKDHIVERCCDLNFRVSPTAFFQGESNIFILRRLMGMCFLL
ncbi:tRNA (Uracil-5-)-methyltransferase A [Paragonimus heterotremus]|uniref:tRNA (Uracil-5-)-methyltransferase A n=1 Tax=Paragonimus heterotremus TaxID=100268 RepID=A0A8J4WFW8_9TREM|nr:tRNA (Uracil-5-)-methyltransferase A [Paragonimus heterotremus]